MLEYTALPTDTIARAKIRGVEQGCFEDPTLDGTDFNYYAHVSKFVTIRMALFRKDRHIRTIATIDISTAFLQSHRYKPHEPRRYVKFKDPVLKEWRYYYLLGPIYGQRSAPIRWEDTIAGWLVNDMKFDRGENEPCVYYNSERDILIIIYVDDLLMDGAMKNIEWFITKLRGRFECKDPEFLTLDNMIDYVGMNITLDSARISIDMTEYATKIVGRMEARFGELRYASVPINKAITDLSSISKEDETFFRSILGAIGWLVNTIRIDLAYAFSRIAQHMAKPNQGALDALQYLGRYIAGTTNLTLSAPVKSESNTWKFYTDSDWVGNREEQNKCRSQLGYLAMLNDAPVIWKSTTIIRQHPHESMDASGIMPPVLSVGEGETMAATAGIMEFMSVSYISSEAHLEDFPQPMIINMDSTVAESFMKNSCLKTKMKHIDVRQTWVRTIRDASIAVPCHIKSEDNLADIFTKILLKIAFVRIRDKLMWSTINH